MGKFKMSFCVAALLAAMLALGGCGGSDLAYDLAESYLSGYFYDAPVEGLAYETSSGISETTKADGLFQYREGDTVTFKVGGIALPAVDAAQYVTPDYYVSEGKITDATPLVQLIMSAGTVTAGKITITATPASFGGETRPFTEILNDGWAAFETAHIKVTPGAADEHWNDSKPGLLEKFAGSYSGTWTGTYVGMEGTFGESGTWTLTVNNSGAVTGTFAGTMSDGLKLGGLVSGTVSASGAVSVTAGDAGGAAWTGSINAATGAISGTFKGDYGDGTDSGTFTGQKGAAADPGNEDPGTEGPGTEGPGAEGPSGDGQGGAYAGPYSGTWQGVLDIAPGQLSGIWDFEVASDGTLSGSATDSASGESMAISGTVSSNGLIEAWGEEDWGRPFFQGTINADGKILDGLWGERGNLGTGGVAGGGSFTGGKGVLSGGGGSGE